MLRLQRARQALTGILSFLRCGKSGNLTMQTDRASMYA